MCVCMHACVPDTLLRGWFPPPSSPSLLPSLHPPSFPLPPFLQGDSLDFDGNVTVSSASYVRPPRVHQYEEIKPKLVYVDLDLDLSKRAKSRTAK